MGGVGVIRRKGMLKNNEYKEFGPIDMFPVKPHVN